MTGMTWMAVAALLVGAAACDGSEQTSQGAAEATGPQPTTGSNTVAAGPGYGRGMGMGPGGPGRGMGPPGGRGGGPGMAARLGPDDCPVTLPDTSVTREDLPDGVAMVFTTEGDVDELRRRVARMAEHHQARHGPGGGPPGRGMGRGRPEGMTPPPESTASAVEIEGGARLELRPTDPEAVDAMRAHVEQHVEGMQDGTCVWMQRRGGP